MITQPGAKALDELERYFSGQLAGEMGLRSPLGLVLEYGGRIPPATDDPGGPGGSALAAARATARIEATLRALPVAHRAILCAFYGSRGPFAPLGLAVLGPAGPVACLLERPDALRELAVIAATKGPGRLRAKIALRGMRARAHLALERAQGAYGAAAELERRRRRSGRLDRFRATVEGECRSSR